MKKINNKGFTLTELLATIAILALVAVIATPAVIGVSNSIKKNMFESNRKLMMRAAVLAAEDAYGDSELHKDLINVDRTIAGKELIRIKYLAKAGYIKCENDQDPLNLDKDHACYKNPKNNYNMNDCEIEIKNVNGRITASWYSTKAEACKWD